VCTSPKKKKQKESGHDELMWRFTECLCLYLKSSDFFEGYFLQRNELGKETIENPLRVTSTG
jgi:hypothetical protein